MFNKVKVIPLYFKIALSFLGLLIALGLIVFFGSRLALGGMQNYFEEVIEERFENEIEELTKRIESREHSIYEIDEDDVTGGYIRPDGVRFDIFDMEDNLIFGNSHKEGNQKAEDDDDFFSEPYDGPKIRGIEPRFIEKNIPIVLYGEEVGYARAKFYDTSVMKPTDRLFFEEVSEVFQYSLIAIVLITLGISFFIARSITRPILKVSRTARKISDGDLKARAAVKSNTKELVQLSDSINTLASKLEEEDTLRMQVTSDMAHEIRTPLTSLRNFFEAFMDGVYEVNDENLGKCHDEVLRMSELVDRLKDIASIEEMTIKSNVSPTDISSETRSICDLSKPAFDKKHIELIVDVEKDLILDIDPGHYKQVLTNLLTNGLRYTDEGGFVKVILHKDIDNVNLVVIDNGIGISKDNQKHIFERFYRADKSRDRETGGLGVGLTIVKKMVNYYGGSIEVHSEIGEGTTFIVKYPYKYMKT